MQPYAPDEIYVLLKETFPVLITSAEPLAGSVYANGTTWPKSLTFSTGILKDRTAGLTSVFPTASKVWCLLGLKSELSGHSSYLKCGQQIQEGMYYKRT